MTLPLVAKADCLLEMGPRCGVSRMRPATECSTGSMIIATGLGPRGPQGLLVLGDRLTRSRRWPSVGRAIIRAVLSAHKAGLEGNYQTRRRSRCGTTIFRGHDAYFYFMAGNGAGISGRTHITESNSPALFEREASVFRISPDGSKMGMRRIGRTQIRRTSG